MRSNSAQRMTAERKPTARSSSSLSSRLVPWRSAVRIAKAPKIAANPPSTTAATVPTETVARTKTAGPNPAAARR